jgi:hypothetical protein
MWFHYADIYTMMHGQQNIKFEFICWQVLESRFMQDGSGLARVWCMCLAIFLG